MNAWPVKFAPPMAVISKALKPDGDGWMAGVELLEAPAA